MAAGTCRSGLAPIDWERLARSEMHTLRLDILELVRLDGGRMLSVNEMAYELQNPIPNVHYHASALAKIGFIVVVAHLQVRGATEHFYVLDGQEGLAYLMKRLPVGVRPLDSAVDNRRLAR